MTTKRRPEDVAKKRKQWERFGKEVRTRREEKDIFLRELARRVNMSPTYLSKVERAEFPPPAEKKVQAIAGELGIDPDYLLARAGKVAQDVKDIIRGNAEAWTALLRAGKGLKRADIQHLTEGLKAGKYVTQGGRKARRSKG